MWELVNEGNQGMWELGNEGNQGMWELGIWEWGNVGISK